MRTALLLAAVVALVLTARLAAPSTAQPETDDHGARIAALEADVADLQTQVAGGTLATTPLPTRAAQLGLPAADLVGSVGDPWLYATPKWGDVLEWSVVGAETADAVSERLRRAPAGTWLVVEIEIVPRAAVAVEEFPFAEFVVEDEQGTIYPLDLTASEEWGAAHGGVGFRFDSWIGETAYRAALVFDVPPDADGLRLRTTDGIIAVGLS